MRSDNEAMSKSMASCPTFAAETMGCLVSSVSIRALLERQKRDTDDDQRLPVQIEGEDRMIKRHSFGLMMFRRSVD
jgi:hypothetical protein